MVRICLFGAGRIGVRHAANIFLSERATLHSVVDTHLPSAEKLANKYGAKAYSSAEEALEDSSVDALWIASSTDTHAELIIKGAATGKPIFCEKPIDLDLARVDECLSAVEKAQVPLLVGFNRRFDHSFRCLHDRVREGAVGKIEMLRITNRDPSPPDINYLATSGGMFRDLSIHDFDTLRWIMNEEPVEVYAAGSCLVDPKIADVGDFDTAMITMKTESGALISINNSRRAVYGYDQRLEVFGSKGMLKANNQHKTTLEHSTAESVSRDTLPYFFMDRFSEAYRVELEHFLDVVLQGTPPLISAHDGRKALQLALAAEESMKTGQPVEVQLTEELQLI